ncbi:helix-turn-helix domain-containing protein, partial [Patescibacteria group bacterium]
MVTNLPNTREDKAKNRLNLLRQAVKEGKSIHKIALDNNISTSYLYQLKSRYLNASNRKDKLKALTPLEDWQRKGKSLSDEQIKEILIVLLANPKLGLLKLASQIYANNGKQIVSISGIQSFFSFFNLNKKSKRQSFARWAKKLSIEELIDILRLSLQRKDKKTPLKPEQRLQAIRLTDTGAPISSICFLYKISRKSFYKWYKRYHQSLPGKEYEAVTNKKPEIERYWGQISQEKEKEILNAVLQNPALSTHKLAQIIEGVGNHGIQNVLKRKDLNTYEKRLTYSQEQYQPVTISTPVVPELPRKEAEVVPSISAIPPPPPSFASRARGILAGLFSGVFLALVLALPIYSWFNLIITAPTLSSKLGLLFATLALIVGSFFFA